MRLYSRRVSVPGGCFAGTVTVEDGKITAFECGPRPDDAVDYGDQRIIPGIFDTHNHGTQGFDLMQEGVPAEGRRKTMLGYLRGLASQGTTSVFPTLGCRDYDLTGLRVLSEISKEQQAHPDGEVSMRSTIRGIHSEGPWLSRVGEKGVRTPWPEVGVSHACDMVEAGNGLLRLVALAPEIEGIGEVIDYFVSAGVTVAAAHSDNDYVGAQAGYARGVSVATHTGNVMTDMHHRNVGGLGAALLNNDVTCEVICDGLHICNEMLRIYFRVKDFSKFEMISDCTAFSGAPAGGYASKFPGVNGMRVTEEGFVLTDTGRLMGSSQPVLFGIGNLVDHVGVPLERCLEMACLNPARTYGLEDRIGSIEPGKDADLVVISDDWRAQVTYVRGHKVFDRSEDADVFNDEFLKEVSL